MVNTVTRKLSVSLCVLVAASLVRAQKASQRDRVLIYKSGERRRGPSCGRLP
jgi:hypothetical protein